MPNQAANILDQTGYNAATEDQHIVTPPINGPGSDGGYIFWMETVHYHWVRRQVLLKHEVYNCAWGSTQHRGED